MLDLRPESVPIPGDRSVEVADRYGNMIYGNMIGNMIHGNMIGHLIGHMIYVHLIYGFMIYSHMIGHMIYGNMIYGNMIGHMIGNMIDLGGHRGNLPDDPARSQRLGIATWPRHRRRAVRLPQEIAGPRRPDPG